MNHLSSLIDLLIVNSLGLSPTKQEQICRESKNNDSVCNHHEHLKIQDVPQRWKRFEQMLARKKDEERNSTKRTTTELLSTKKTLKEDESSVSGFDVTQWENTIWAKGLEKNSKLCSPEDDDRVGEGEGKANIPLAEEIPGEAFYLKVDKGSILLKPAHISIAIDTIELAVTIPAMIIMLFTYKYILWNVLYPLWNAVVTTGFIIWLILMHSLHLYVHQTYNSQGIPENRISYRNKSLFLYCHILRCVISITTTCQAVYFALMYEQPVLFILIVILSIIQGFCAAIQLYYASLNRFALCLNL